RVPLLVSRCSLVRGCHLVTTSSELKDRASLRDHRRANRPTDVLLDPPSGTLGRLVRADLVLADRHSHATVAAAKGRVADEARHPTDEALHVLLPLPEEIEQLRGTLPGIAPNDYVHDAFLSRGRCHIGCRGHAIRRRGPCAS